MESHSSMATAGPMNVGPDMPTFHAGKSASHIGRKPAFGQTCSMKTLLQDGILQTGQKVLCLEYEGRRFYGDLRSDGTIMMRNPGDDTPHIYATPVAWANHCCKMLNPESKPLNAWSSIRFKGKRLDSYKLKWYRAQKSNKSQNDNGAHHQNNQASGSNMNLQNNVLMVHNPITTYENPLKNKKLIKSLLINYNMDNDCKRLVAKSLDLTSDPSMNSSEPCKTVINYEQLGTRGPHNTHNPNTMVKCIPFSAVDRIQPFNVTVSTNALLLIDFHSHLVTGEVAGYLGGYWDPGQHVLIISQAFPCKTNLDDETNAARIDEEIRQDIATRNLSLVGWYHSHQGKYSNYPTIRDIQTQIEYQIKMKESPGGYTPCVGLICSPHDTRSEEDLSPSFQIYWIMPPPEHLGNHYGRPMQMYYSVTRDLFLTQDLLLEMRLLANHYTACSTDMVDFRATYEHNIKVSNLEKLSGSIKPKLPKDLQESEYPEEPNIWKAAIDHFWKFLRNLVISPDESEVKSNDGEKEEESNADENSANDPPMKEQQQAEDEPVINGDEHGSEKNDSVKSEQPEQQDEAQPSHSSKKSTSSKRVTISCRVKESEPGLVKLAALTTDHANGANGVGYLMTGDTRCPLISLLLNLYLCCVYGYSFYFMYLDEQGSQFNRVLEAPLQKFTLFRFLTFNTLVVQLASSVLHLVTLVVPKCKPLRDITFSAFAFPLSCIVVFSFWAVYLTRGREYIYPVMLEIYFPHWLNHVVHTMILPANLGLAYLTNHNYYKCGAAILFVFLSIYYGYLIFIKLVTGMFPYFFMDRMCLVSRVIYLGTTFFCSLAFYQIGRCLNRYLHPKKPDGTAKQQQQQQQQQQISSAVSTPAASPK